VIPNISQDSIATRLEGLVETFMMTLMLV